MKTVTLSPDLVRAVHGVIQAIGSDCEGLATRPSEWAELAIDADRLTTFGYPEADAEVKRLIGEFGYSKVLKAIARHTNY